MFAKIVITRLINSHILGAYFLIFLKKKKKIYNSVFVTVVSKKFSDLTYNIIKIANFSLLRQIQVRYFTIPCCTKTMLNHNKEKFFNIKESQCTRIYVELPS